MPSKKLCTVMFFVLGVVSATCLWVSTYLDMLDKKTPEIYATKEVLELGAFFLWFGVVACVLGYIYHVEKEKEKMG